MDRYWWLVFAVLAGLCWGTYVPFVQLGIRELGRNAYGSFLCVGVAYFLIAVLFPLGLFLSGADRPPDWTATGITFATLAGVAGALGALCVIFANRFTPVGSDFRMYIGPVIFALAPLLNTLISLVWHPSREAGYLHFDLKALPDWKFVLGIVLTGLGAFLVLYSKEETERAHAKLKPAAAPPSAVASAEPGQPAPQ
jgi:hypothetical protein